MMQEYTTLKDGMTTLKTLSFVGQHVVGGHTKYVFRIERDGMAELLSVGKGLYKTLFQYPFPTTLTILKTGTGLKVKYQVRQLQLSPAPDALPVFTDSK